MNLGDAKEGMRVRYVPHHACGNRAHPDCEDGIVSSVNERYVFVRFSVMQTNGIACDPDDLVKTL